MYSKHIERVGVLLLAAIAGLASAKTGEGAIAFFTTTPNSDYATGANWNTGLVPGNGNNDEPRIGQSNTASAIYSTPTGYTTTSRFLIGFLGGGNGSLTLNPGAGTLTFGGDNFGSANYVGVDGGTGALTMNAGTITLTGAAGLNIGCNAATATGVVTVNSGATINVGSRLLMGANNAANLAALNINGGTVNVGTGGAGTFAEPQTGILRLGAGTTAVNLNGGLLSLYSFQSDSASAANTVVSFNGGTVQARGSNPIFFTNSANNATGVYTTRIQNGGVVFDTNGFDIGVGTALVQDAGSPGGGLTKIGLGTLTLSGANTYTGLTAVNAGVLQINSTASLPGSVNVAPSGALRLLSSNTAWTNTVTGSGLVQIQFAPVGASNTTLNNITGFTGTVELTTTGATGDKWTTSTNAPGVTVKVNSGTQLFLGGASTFAGVQIIGTGNTENRGAIRLSNTLNAPVTLLGNATIGTEGGTITGPVTSGAAGTQTLTIGAPSNNTLSATFNGAIGGGAGAIALNVATRGDVRLSGNNTYTGGTTVSFGRLVSGVANGFGAGSVTVATGAQAYLTTTTFNNQFFISGDGGSGSSLDTQPRGALRIEGATIGSSGGVTLQADSSIGAYNNGVGTVNAVISGPWALSINKSSANSPGTIVLGGANAYTGGTTVYNGTLQLNGNNRLWTGGAITVAGGVLDLGAGSQTTSGAVSFQGGIVTNGTLVKSGAAYDAQSGAVSATLAGSAGLTKSTAGTLVLSGAHNTYAGATIISQGTLRLQAPPTTPVAGALYWLDATTGVVETGGSVSAWNDQTANGRNFTQATAASQPQYVAGALNGKPVVRFDGLASPNSDVLVLGSATSPQSIFIVNRPAAFLGNLDGIWGSNSDVGIRMYAGPSWGNPGNSGDFSNPAGSAMYINGVLQPGNGAFVVGQPQLVEVIRSSAIAFGNTSLGLYYLPGNRRYQGDIAEVIAYGTALSAADRLAVEQYLNYKWFGTGVTSDILPTATAVQLASGATLDLGGISQTIGSLADYGGGGGTVTNSAASTPLTLTINPAGGSTTFSGQITDSGAAGAVSLVKSGAGTQVLAGTSTYSGSTTVTAGKLLVNGSIASPVTVHAGTLGGSGTIHGTVTVGDSANPIDAYLAPGNSPGILHLAGGLTMQSDSALVAEINGTTPGLDPNGYDQVDVTGPVILNNPQLQLLFGFAPSLGDQFVLIQNDSTDPVQGTFAGLPEGAALYDSTFGFQPFVITYRGLTGNDIVLTAVPEPSTLALMCLGLAGLSGYLWRRRARG